MKDPVDKRFASICLAAIGVVFGDIGTSPMYTLKEVFAEEGGVALNDADIVGAVSTIFWALMCVVTLKYVILVLRADNRGEGGIMALLTMALSSVGRGSRYRNLLLVLGTFGAALFLGETIVTPAITVLGAMEGLELVTPALERFVLPMAVGAIVVLFLMQKHGTGHVGRLFGPVIMLWFIVLGLT